VLLCDPLLVGSLGFQLSVGATLAMVVGAGPLARCLPGPRWLALPLAVTLAAQLGVAPLLILTFGPVGLASLPANLLAVPAAGPLMVWGLTAGLVAGVVGEPWATLVHLPSRVLLAWIDGVATVAGRAPLGKIGLWQWAALMAAAALVVWCADEDARRGSEPRLATGGRAEEEGRRGSRPRLAAVGLAVSVMCLAVVLASAVVPARPASDAGAVTPTAAGVQLWQGGGATLVAVDGRATDDGLVSAVHGAGLSRLDVLVVRTDADRAAAVATSVRERWPRLVVLVPTVLASRVPGAVTPPAGTVLDVGGLRVTFGETSSSLTPTVEVLPRR
jgi:competence protein ComEC